MGSNGLGWFKILDNELSGPLAKLLLPNEKEELLKFGNGILVFQAGDLYEIGKYMDVLRRNLFANKAEDITNVKGWRIIKNLPASTTSWYSGDDNFSGNYTLNDTTKLLTEEWSVSYSNVDWDEILFIKGDFDQWIRLNKSALFVESTWSTQTSIETHLGVGTTYLYFNDGRPYTPYIASSNSYDHNKILYKENTDSTTHVSHFASENYTYNVFIRKSTDFQSVYNPI